MHISNFKTSVPTAIVTSSEFGNNLARFRGSEFRKDLKNPEIIQQKFGRRKKEKIIIITCYGEIYIKTIIS